MFEISKKCAAVSNGTENALKSAKCIVASNDEDGVALFLNSL